MQIRKIYKCSTFCLLINTAGTISPPSQTGFYVNRPTLVNHLIYHYVLQVFSLLLRVWCQQQQLVVKTGEPARIFSSLYFSISALKERKAITRSTLLFKAPS